MSTVRKSLLATIVPLTFVPVSAMAQTVTITLSVTQNLVFGSLDSGATGGGFRVRPDGSSAPTGGSTVTSVGVITPQPGQISIFGSTGFPIDLSITTTVINLNNGTTNISVNDFQLRTNSGGVAETITLPTDTQVAVGATVNLAGGQAQGAYTGTYTVNAIYQ